MYYNELRKFYKLKINKSILITCENTENTLLLKQKVLKKTLHLRLSLFCSMKNQGNGFLFP